MSTPKKIRSNYELTFKKLIYTSPAGKKLRLFLSSIRNPVPSFNLPITLADVRNKLLSPLKPVKSAKPVKKKKPARRKAVKKAVKKIMKKPASRRRKSKK